RVEAQRADARATRPEAALIPLWTELHRERERLRALVEPEGECDAFPQWAIDELTGHVLLRTASFAVFRIPIFEPIETTDLRGRSWSLGALDYLLDVIAAPANELRAALVRALARPAWARDLDRLDNSLKEATASEEVLGWRFHADRPGELRV